MSDRLTREEALTRLEIANLIEERAIQTGRFVETVADFQTAFGAAYSSAELAAHFVEAREIARTRLRWTPAARERAALAAKPAFIVTTPTPAPHDWRAEAFAIALAVVAVASFIFCIVRHGP